MTGALTRLRGWVRRRAGGLGVLAATTALAVGGASPARAAEAFIHVNTPALVLVPSAQDYANDYVDATGAAGIAVKLKTNNPAGLILKVRSSGAGNTLRLGDLLVRTLTPAGRGGAALSTWTPLALTDLTLWSIGVAQGPFATVATDLRIRNIGSYDDAAASGTTSYSHTLIFTVISP